MPPVRAATGKVLREFDIVMVKEEFSSSMENEINAPVRIFIVDDHQMLIDGIKALLRKEKHLQFVGESNNGMEALQFVRTHPVDLVMTDISMPGMNGIELTRTVKSESPHIKVLVLSMYHDPEMVAQIFAVEAEGYILKNTGKEELLSAISRIVDDGSFYSSEVISSLMKQRNAPKPRKEENIQEILTKREIEIVKLICMEYTTAQIADQLYISPRTVDTHRKNILLKTASKNIVSLIKLAYQSSLI